MPPVAATTTRKLGERKDCNEANPKDSFILHRFKSILTWVESMNLSLVPMTTRTRKKAADDQDNIALSKVDKRAATRLRLHLDLSPSDAVHEKLAGEFTYPEWNHRSRSYMDAHCRVLDAPRTARCARQFHSQRRPPLGMTVGLGQFTLHDKLVPVLHQRLAHEAQLA